MKNINIKEAEDKGVLLIHGRHSYIPEPEPLQIPNLKYISISADCQVFCTRKFHPAPKIYHKLFTPNLCNSHRKRFHISMDMIILITI